MKRFILFILLLGASIWLGLQIQKDSGYALFAYRLWTVEMPLWCALFLTIIAFGIFYALLRLISNTGSLRARFHNWATQRRHRRSRKKMNLGLIELAEGNWPSGEMKLVRAAKYSETPLINYLAAAYAAQEQKAYDRRDEYLRLAHQSAPSSEIAVGLVQAQLQLQHQQLEQALATLTHLRAIVPHHPYILKLLKELYLRLYDWKDLADLLPSLRKYKALSPSECDQLEQYVYQQWLSVKAPYMDLEALRAFWESIPRTLQRDTSLLQYYIPSLIKKGGLEEAEAMIREAMKKQWDSSLIYSYGLVATEDHAKQLASAEIWLKSKPHDSVLLLTLGRLCIQNQLWGKARSYLEYSLEIDPQPETCQVLGDLLMHLNEQEAAAKYYQRGLALAIEHDKTYPNIR